MTVTWAFPAPGVLALPTGRRIRGRGLRRATPTGPVPDFAVYLLGDQPPAVPWSHAWLRRRDFWLPSDVQAVRLTLREAWERSATQRVELACGGGRGRTGTALSCLAVIDGVDPADAVGYVRRHYDQRAVETPWQRRFVERFDA